MLIIFFVTYRNLGVSFKKETTYTMFKSCIIRKLDAMQVILTCMLYYYRKLQLTMSIDILEHYF